jgi:signal transduction histidine kinase
LLLFHLNYKYQVTLCMRVGTQLGVMMLAYFAPIGLACTMVTGRSTTRIGSQAVKAKARIAVHALNAAVVPEVKQGKWDELRYTMSTIGSKVMRAALLDESGRLQSALPGFPTALPALNWISEPLKSESAAEFMRRADGRLWFCRIEPLATGSGGYVLLAQDWTALDEDRRRQIARSLLANAGLLLAGIIGIPLLVRRYVTRLLDELHRRLRLPSNSNIPGHPSCGSETELNYEDFRHINQQLGRMCCRLFQAAEQKLQLERRRLNADKLDAIATLASGFAHAVGTPLGVIRGTAEMALSGDLEQSEMTENFELIIRQIDDVTRMVKVLLEVGQCRAAIRVASDVRAVAGRAIHLLGPEAARRGVEVIANLGSRPLMVDCDPDQLEQVFVNLEINALDAMAWGGGILRVNSVVDEVQGKIRLSFEDTGPGVPIAIRDRIFDPFFTTKGSGKRDGMGLAISQSIIGQHDGELILESRAHGACFVITLPASRPLELEPST